MSIKGLLPSHCGKLWIAACEACWESTWYCCYPPATQKHFLLYCICTPVSFCGVLKPVSSAGSKSPFPAREERKALILFILSTLSPTVLRKREASSCPFCVVLVYLYVCTPVCIVHAYEHECDCACKSMCDNIIQMPHHTVGLCQSHPMKHTEQMLIVKS